ncbi:MULTISPECIES: hypothetical protein [unclassified Neptuniibacter]|jgi:hypothetical protein|uniref:hypothetical protein n=1 Tax=unclassified Neptuniibacter TaxID=2630693 RepID=UPI0026E3E7C7|nr:MULTISPECIES: hypothetical protein [unclassified Neptuniibacter]MDO6514973.1 hypothetical protein [Neptuniibacter sp. 2_MG-2023]MDO6594268.1 hypothetical protein [Neptuniibacter sp. 1_MG-2023]
MSSIDKKEIRSDKWMNLLIKTGLPIAFISIISLWVGWYFKIPELGNLFIITAATALTLGMIYNVRFVILSVRQIKAKQAKEK